jgi:hypothetical protein
MQILPDWNIAGTLQELEERIGNIKLSKPGLYLTKTDIGLLEDIGNGRFMFYYWNASIEKTIFSQTFPIISDER